MDMDMDVIETEVRKSTTHCKDEAESQSNLHTHKIPRSVHLLLSQQ